MMINTNVQLIEDTYSAANASLRAIRDNARDINLVFLVDNIESISMIDFDIENGEATNVIVFYEFENEKEVPQDLFNIINAQVKKDIEFYVRVYFKDEAYKIEGLITA